MCVCGMGTLSPGVDWCNCAYPGVMWVASVVSLLWLSLALPGHAVWTHTQSLDSDLDNQLCPSKVNRGSIIDIHESMAKGAELMDGLTKDSLEECMAGCCRTSGCDLALFKNEGLSKTGKNCYYVHCGLKENCVLVQHESFTSVTFMPSTSAWGLAKLLPCLEAWQGSVLSMFSSA